MFIVFFFWIFVFQEMLLGSVWIVATGQNLTTANVKC